jgi:hypothetical protein
MTRVFSLLLTLLFSLGDPAMRESSVFGCSLLAAKTTANANRIINEPTRQPIAMTMPTYLKI